MFVLIFFVDWYLWFQFLFVEIEIFKFGVGGVFEKEDVCEGDVDGFEINFSGKCSLRFFLELILIFFQVYYYFMLSMRLSISFCMDLM